MTELDLRHSLIPDELINEMVKSMPEHRGANVEDDMKVPKYDYISFMQKLMNERAVENGHP